MKYYLALCTLLSTTALSGAALADAAQNAKKVDEAFAKLDANKDGKISRDEAKNGPKISSHFDAIDTNKDGFITPSFRRFWTRTSSRARRAAYSTSLA
jgi:Ca2+-binding EF-hand superfamily protein